MRHRNRFSILAPFFAALLLAASFFYFQWSYTKLKTIDFEKNVFYGKGYIFSPEDDEYMVMMYNSKSSDFRELVAKIPDKGDLKILAIDFYQNINQESSNQAIPLSAGMNTLLKTANIFKITALPVYFTIKRKSLSVFFQDTKIYEIK